MEAHIEALVGSYLTRGGSVFISPQFNIPWNKDAGEGGAVPDFVALDFEMREILVVEVTTADALGGLVTKIKNRHQHWYPPVWEQLKQLGVIDERWKSRFLGFVREARLPEAKRAFPGSNDVSFYPLEHALLEYAYSDERKKGLPR
jgi:hypothetical protein